MSEITSRLSTDLDDRYRIEREVGAGAALHPDGDRFVASILADAAPATVASAGQEWRYLVVLNWFTELKERLGN